MIDPKVLGKVLGEKVKELLTPIRERLDVLEKSAPEKGDTGPPGKDGIDGKSIKGDQGERGVDGAPGLPGKDGIDGKDGRDGISAKGDQGERGADGAPGKDGVDGKDGAPGKDGRDGIDGKSFTLEDAAPLVRSAVAEIAPTLKGEKGDQGEKGERGADGHADMAALNSSLQTEVRTFLDGWQKGSLTTLKGEKGDQGERGIDGKDGADAVIDPLVIRQTIADVVAGMSQSLRGEKGATGDTGQNGKDGKDGIKGDPGEKGQDGRDGAEGRQGAIGDKGDKGDPGPAGRDGDKGLDGKDGADGRDGKDGVDGKGEKGAPGRDGIDGVDGKSFTLDEVRAIVKEVVTVHHANHLLELERTFVAMTQRAIDQMPKAKDGKDGIGLKDCTFDAESGTFNAVLADGTIKSFETDCPYHFGVWEEKVEYRSGAVVSSGGNGWISNRKALPDERPGQSNAWVLFVKKGRDAPRS